MKLTVLAALFFVASAGILASFYFSGIASKEDNIHDIVEKASYCTEDNDCVFIDKPCNIVGCGIAVNENEAARISFMVNVYNFPKGAPPCLLACNKSTSVACISSKCTIR